MQLSMPIFDEITTDVRRKNILSSPKSGGSCDIDSKPYLKELGIEILERRPADYCFNV